MKSNSEKAKELLAAEGFTCVLVKEETVYTSRERGVQPLLRLIDDGTDVKDFSAADKVVGNGVAYLYVYLGVKEVFAEVISEPAVKTLQRYGVLVEYNTCVENIKNREGTGLCPMEIAVKKVPGCNAALRSIRRALFTMKEFK